MIRKTFLSTILFLVSAFVFAQDGTQQVDMADTMRSNGKIYVVVAVIVVIVIALFAYLFYLDRKIARMEKEHDQQ